MYCSLDENIKKLENAFDGCGDFVCRKFSVGRERPVWLYTAYLDMMANRSALEFTVINPLQRLGDKRLPVPDEFGRGMFELLKDCGISASDMREETDLDELVKSILMGDTAMFIDGFDKAIVIATRGFPNRGVPSVETEAVVQGSKEAFSEVFRINTALIRRRIRDPRLKIKQLQLGRRSVTDVALVYMEDIVRPGILQEAERRIAELDVDGIFDIGYIEQYIEDDWRSPFPQAQITERPDKAAASLLEGRIVVIADNSPFVLIIPVTLNTFLHSSEDYYNRFHIMTLVRIIRYAAMFIAVALPAFYIVAAVYHPSMLPLLMILKISAARQPVPFSAAVEILMMDAAFELLREAGIRLPKAAGSTIGIVGGLIIGQAAVEAGLVSPIVVIVVALAGVSTFAIPNVSLVAGFRTVKYFVIILSAVLGMLGFWAGMIIVLIHLAGLRSFGVPYLMPYAAGEMNGGNDWEDSIFRKPLFTMRKRPFFANPKNRRR